MAQQLFDSTRVLVRLGDEISSGGEGAVYEIQGDPSRVAKIWHENRQSAERAAKLQTMRRISCGLTIRGFPILAWPDEILYEGNKLVGYRMPKAENADALFNFMNPRTRQQIGVNMNPSELALLAQRISLIFKALHQNQCYIGDVNDQNILVRRDNLIPIIIDSDSFQIQNPANANQPFLSQVRVPFYQPPERKDIRQPIGPSTDAFGLAVITYKLLVDNEHPFLGIDSISEANPPSEIAERIQASRFAHARQRTWVPRPNARNFWNDLPDETRKALIQALDYEQHGTDRPSAQEMIDALEKLAEPARSAPPRQANPRPQPAPQQQTNPQPRPVPPQQTNPQPRPAPQQQTNPQPRPVPPQQANPQPRPVPPQQPNPQPQPVSTQQSDPWEIVTWPLSALWKITNWAMSTLSGAPGRISIPTIAAGVLFGGSLHIFGATGIIWQISVILLAWGAACIWLAVQDLGHWPPEELRDMLKALPAGAVVAGVTFLIIALINLFFP